MGWESPNATEERMNIMKRALSLLLTFAMVMSLFTTAAFAADAAPTVTLDGYPVKNDGNSAVVYYVGTKPDLTKLKVSGDGFAKIAYEGDKLTYYAGGTVKEMTITPKAVTLTVTATAAETGEYKSQSGKVFYYMKKDAVAADSDFTVTADGGAKAATKVSNGKILADITVDGAVGTQENVDTGYTVQDKTYVAAAQTFKVPGDFQLDLSKLPVYSILGSGAKATAVSLEDSYGGALTVTDDLKIRCAQVSALGGKTTAKATYNVGDYKIIVPLSLVESSTDVTVTMTNGDTKTYSSAAALKKLVATKLGTTENNISSIKLEVPKSTSLMSFIVDDASKATEAKLDMAAVSKLKVKAGAGYIGSVDVKYQAVVDGKIYEGKITFKSDYDTAVTDTQSAPFYAEKFHLNSISGIKYLTLDDDATTPKGESDYHTDADFMVDPDGHTEDWKQNYVGYDKDGVAKKVTVTFEPIKYDALIYTEDNAALFQFDLFETFAEKVNNEQDDHYDISVGHIRFTEVKGTKWQLEKSGSVIKSSDEFTESKLSDVTLDVSASGYYDIPFKVYFDYKATKSSSWTTATSSSYDGRVRVYAAMDGDITYEVLYNDTVTFDSSDFEALYKSKTSKSKTLSSVTVDVLPYYGTLYSNAKTTSAYKVDVDDVFYVDPSTANKTYALDKLTYWSNYASTKEYSDYVVVTMHGTGGDEVAVVEIKVNGELPFTDVAKNSTFYEYIQYVYTNEIMNGKSATKFDAKSNISRVQLVTTLYRMAGSPATYNGIALPFTDIKGLSTEFTNAVKWAYSKGVVTGVTATKFAPTDAVTRQAMVTILYRYAKTSGYDVGVLYGNHLGGYTDGGKVSSKMADAMNWAVDYDLISGNGNKLNPGGSTTRGAAAKILANFHKNYIA